MSEIFLSHRSNGSTARIFNAASFVNSLANGVTGPLMVVYLLSIHLTPAQIGILLAIGRLAMIVFEFPTGMFADRYGRKKSLLVSFALSSLLLVGWYLSTSFLQILILSIVSGMAYTFQSGAKESLMIDALRLADNDSLRNRAFVRIGSWGNMGFVVGGALAAALSFFSLRSIWLAAATCNGVLFLLFALRVRERDRTVFVDAATGPLQLLTPRWNETFVLHIRNLFATGKEAVRSVFISKPLLLLSGVAAFFSFAIALYGLTYPVYFKQMLHLPDYLFGLLGSISALVGIVGMLMGEKMCARRGYSFVLRVFALLLALSFAALGFLKVAGIAIFIFVMIEMLIHGWYPTYQSFFNKFVPDAVRASVLSLQSVIGLVSIAAGELLVGALLTFVPPPTVIQYGSLLLLVIFFLLGKRRSNNRSTLAEHSILGSST